MYELCVNIGGTKRCIPLPSLIDSAHLYTPKPTNYPPFELAIAVLQLVNAVPDSELSRELSKVANRFIEEVKEELPPGTELVIEEKDAMKAA